MAKARLSELERGWERSTDMRAAGGSLLLVRFTVAVVCVARAPLPASDANRLPAPTGPFGVGRVTILCEDPSRIEPFAPNAGARRIIADVWYPTDPSSAESGPAAEYLNTAAFARALGSDGLRTQLGRAYELVQGGSVATHARSAARFASSLRRAPVLIFSPGGGMIRELYTAQLEDLASHGYVSAAITHPYDGFLAVYPDGQAIAHDGKRWPPQPSFEGAANLNQLEWHADDIRAVLDQLAAWNSPAASSLPFAGRLDLTRVGAFGHSFGGIAAARACQKDARIRACLNQDGAIAMKPFYLDTRGWGMDQAFMLIERAPKREPPTDGELAEMKVTRARIADILKRLNADRDRALGSSGTGSYRVLLRREGTTHMDFSDLPVLGARDEAEMKARTRVLAVVRSYTRAFFDRHVGGRKARILDGRIPDPILESVERFGPAKRPKAR